VALAVGEPLAIAPDATVDQLELARIEVERRLIALESRAARML